MIRYQNFDLSIERRGDGYLARVLESPAGEASAQFNIPFSLGDVENIFLQVSRSRLLESPEAKKIHSFGQELFEAIFQGDVRNRLRASLGEVNKQGAGLRLRLRIASLTELGNFPWEFMYDPSLSRFLALSVDTPIVRYLETQQVIQPLIVQPPLRILTMICSPKNYPRLDVEREWQNLQEAMSDLQSRGLVDLQRLASPTLSALQQSLRRDQFHIFHFIGHGMFSTTAQDGLLLLEDERREGYRLSGRDLGTLLHDHRPLRLAVLNACEGARTSSEDQFAGTAQSLMQQGIPAVIAMQFRITDQAAIVLAHEFYGALADGYPVDAALTEARKAIKTQGNDLEWGTPVLYMRSPDGQIFQIDEPSPAARPAFVPAPDPAEAARIERVYTEALESFYLGKWEESHRRLQEVVDAQPSHKDAAAELEIARRKMRLQIFNEQAAAAEKVNDWDKTIEALEKLLAEDASFADAAPRLARARRQKQLADLYAEAQRLSQAEKWQAVLEIFREIDAVNPRNPDPQGLRTSAEQNLAKAKKTKDIETAYTSALTALDSAAWSDAIRHLRRVRGLRAGYRESESLLRRAESELEHARKEKSKPQKREQKVKTAVGQSTHPEWLVVALLFAFVVTRLISQWFGDLLNPILSEETGNIVVLTSAYMIPAGLFSGLAIWWFLSKAVGPLLRRETILMIITCTLAQTIVVDVGIASPNSNQVWFWVLLWAIIGLTSAIPIALVLKRAELSFNKKQFALVLVGWTLGYGVGVILGNHLRSNLIEQFGQQTGFMLSVLIEQISGSLVGGLVLLSQTSTGRYLRINWKTILAGTLGFGLGNLLANIIVAPLEESTLNAAIQMLVWGLIGGASLAFPSKNFRHYLALGLLGGLGMMLGYLALIALGNPDGLNKVITGMVLGVFLGFRTRRVSAALILALVAPMGYFLRSILNSYYYSSALSMSESVKYIILALTAGLMGAIIGSAWSFLNPEKQNTK